MTKKEMLIHLIKDKNCKGFYTYGICKICPMWGLACSGGNNVYNKAIVMYLELYGKKELLEVLI